MSASTRVVLGRAITQSDGKFTIPNLPAGDYLVAATVRRFRERMTRILLAESDHDLGQLTVPFSDCDAPDLTCEADPVILPSPEQKRATVENVTLWIASTNDVFQFRLEPDKSMWLHGRGRATLAEMNLKDACGEPNKAIRVDGLGRGAEFCIVTDTGLPGHLYVTAEVIAGSDSVPIRIAVQR